MFVNLKIKHKKIINSFVQEKLKHRILSPYSNQGGKCHDISVIYRRNIEYRSISTRYMLEKYRFHDILLIYRDFHLFLGIYWHFIILSSIYRDNLGG